MPHPCVDIEDPDSLRAYLAARQRLRPGEAVDIRTLAGGVSNKTVLVKIGGGPAWVLKQALPRLRVAVEWLSDPARIGREALALRWLPALAPEGTITPLVFEDPDNFILAMEAVPEPHDNWKSLLLAGNVNADHVKQFARLLANIHLHSAERSAELAPLFAERAFFQSLRLEPYYAYSAQHEPNAKVFLEQLITDTLGRRLTLVHGDYSPKNVLVHQDKLILLDHEVIHWGDPAFDLGFALTHLLSKAHHLPAHRAAFGRSAAEFWRHYADDVGARPWTAGLEPMAVRHALACLLARVAGRSPLEYLGPAQRRAQRQAVLSLMADPPATVDELVEKFLMKVE